MIFKKIDLKNYKKEFEKKFTNFGEKAPIMLSYFYDDLGVTVVCENSGIQYFYDWNVTIPVKSFIHRIKEDLSEHYPRICRDVEIQRAPTSEELANMIAEGTSVNELPSSVVEKRSIIYRIDKILALQDTLILVDEETKEQYNYRYPGAIYFLRNYRNGEYNSLYTAGDEFFNKAELITKLQQKI